MHVKHRFPFIIRKNEDPAYNEAKRGYFEKIFTKNRNEKPGKDFYFSYTTVMFLICLYILLFYTQMIQDKTFSKIDLDTTQFSGSMVLYLILHIFIIIIDRIIFVSQNRDNLQYEYIFYKRNDNNQQGELLTEVEENELKSEISKNNKSKYKITNLPRQEIEKQLKKYNIVFIQKETFNYPLLIKIAEQVLTRFEDWEWHIFGEGKDRKFVFDIQPYSYQQEILDKLNAEREVLGYTRNLVVAATGCGKTVISAFDYTRYSRTKE